MFDLSNLSHKFNLKYVEKQINNKRKLVNLYKDIVLVTRVRIFCTTLFTNNNIKVVIQINAFLMDHAKNDIKIQCTNNNFTTII